MGRSRRRGTQDTRRDSEQPGCGRCREHRSPSNCILERFHRRHLGLPRSAIASPVAEALAAPMRCDLKDQESIRANADAALEGSRRTRRMGLGPNRVSMRGGIGRQSESDRFQDFNPNRLRRNRDQAHADPGGAIGHGGSLAGPIAAGTMRYPAGARDHHRGWGVGRGGLIGNGSRGQCLACYAQAEGHEQQDRAQTTGS